MLHVGLRTSAPTYTVFMIIQRFLRYLKVIDV